MVGYTFNLLSEGILYLLQTYLTVAKVTLLCYHGNHTKGKFVQFDVPTHHHCREIYIISITWGYYLLPWQPLRDTWCESQGLWS